MQQQKLGLRGSEITLVCPDQMRSTWDPAVAEATAELQEIFGDLVTDIQQIGTGGIQNSDVTLYCKPIIDLAVSVTSIQDARQKIPQMRTAGYLHRFKRDNENRIFFIKRNEIGAHTHHIYILQQNCVLWKELIYFRDYLSIHSDKLKKYMTIKRDLAQKYPYDRNLYNRSRAKFMYNVSKESNEYFTLNREITVQLDVPVEADAAYVIGMEENDASQQPVYVIGASAGETTFSGRVAAIAHNPNGSDCLVAVPTDRMIYEPEIEHLLCLQANDPAITYSCSHEKSCGAVLYTMVNGERRYLLIKNRSLHAGFPKGHIEYGETEMDTVRREIMEETGLQVDIVDGFRRAYDYKVRFFIHKTAVYFLAGFANQTIIPQEGEVLDYWIIPLEEALSHLGFEQDRAILTDADNYLNQLGL